MLSVICPSAGPGTAYLLEPFRNGSDRSHAAGEGREHVPIRAHGTVEVPLLKGEKREKQQELHGKEPARHVTHEQGAASIYPAWDESLTGRLSQRRRNMALAAGRTVRWEVLRTWASPRTLGVHDAKTIVIVI